jgi:methyl-accepting chemotaxis protein
MHSTIDGLKKVSTQMEEVSSATGRLKDSSLKVNDVLVFMNEIAEKTTLLSLNANIEAARAGSAGHGFSVVASEISKLSVQSVRGTEEIKKIIGATLLDLESVLAAIDLSLEIVQKNAEESNAVTAELQLMMENIHANSAQISKIYQGMENLAQMNDAIMNGANNLASIAEETSAGTQEISATTQNQTTNVDRIVEQSKVLEQMASRLDVLVNPNA